MLQLWGMAVSAGQTEIPQLLVQDIRGPQRMNPVDFGDFSSSATMKVTFLIFLILHRMVWHEMSYTRLWFWEDNLKKI